MVYSAFRDENSVPVAIGVSSTSATTVLPFKISSVTGRLLTDAASGSGTVTDVSVVSANGFAGSVATSTTTPAITLTTTINAPVLKGNGTALSAATTTGSGSTVVLNNTPTLITPVLGVATATSINKVTISAPGTSATLTIADGKTLTSNVSMTLQGGDASVLSIAASKTLTASVSMTLQGGDASVLSIAASKTLTVSNILTFTGTDNSSVAFGTGGTVLYTASTIPLTVGSTTIASGTSTRILYDNAGTLGEYTVTGSGTTAVLSTSPTLTTSVIVPLVVGGTGTTGTQLTLQTTSGNGTTDAMVVKGGNNGGTTFATFTAGALSILTSGVFTTGTIELGAASDTTIARVGAGQISVEGVNVVTTSSSDTLTNKTLTSPTIQTSPVLAAGTNMKFTLPADLTATGDITNEFNSGYTSTAIGDLVYLDSSATWQKAKADSATTSTNLLGIALSVTASASPATVLLRGFIQAASPFPTLTVGAPVYISGATAGAVVVAQPTTTDYVIRVVGHAIHADKMWFNPSGDWITHT